MRSRDDERGCWRRDARGRWHHDARDLALEGGSRFPAIVSLVLALHIGAGALVPGREAMGARESFESRISLESPPEPPETPPPPEPEPVSPPAPAPRATPPVAVPQKAMPRPTVLETATGTNDVAIDAVVGEAAVVPETPPPPPEPVVAAPAPAPMLVRVDPGPTIVPAKSLGRMPHPPALDRELERNYPAEARRAGIAGSATLRLQVLSDGRLGRVQQLAESHPGFGPACERTVRAARWEPPLDRDGHAVATEIKYVCKFEVRS